MTLWDPDTGKALERLECDTGGDQLTAVAFSPDGSRIAATSKHAIRIWDLVSRQQVNLIKVEDEVWDLDWHPTRNVVATGSKTEARLWDLDPGELLQTLGAYAEAFDPRFHHERSRVRFAPDGSQLLVGQIDGTVRFWNVESGKLERTIFVGEWAITDIDIAAERDLLATVGPVRVLKLWRLSSGDLLHEIKLQVQNARTASIAFHPRKPIVYSCHVGLHAWSTDTGEHLGELVDRVYSDMAVRPDGTLIATAEWAVRLWDSASGQPHIEVASHAGAAMPYAFTPDGSRLVTGGVLDRTLRVWDVLSKQLVATHVCEDGSSLLRASVSPDGTTFAAWNWHFGTMEVRNVDGTVRHSVQGDIERRGPGPISPDGRWLVTWDISELNRVGNAVAIWNVPEGKLHGEVDRRGGWLLFSADSRKLLAAGGEPTPRVSVWDVETMQEESNVEIPGIARVYYYALSPDGTTLALEGPSHVGDGAQPRLVFWDLAAGKPRQQVELGDYWISRGMSFSADGSTLMIARHDGEVRLLDAHDGGVRQSIQVLDNERVNMGSVAFAPDGQHFAVGMNSGVTYILRIPAAP